MFFACWLRPPKNVSEMLLVPFLELKKKNQHYCHNFKGSYVQNNLDCHQTHKSSSYGISPRKKCSQSKIITFLTQNIFAYIGKHLLSLLDILYFIIWPLHPFVMCLSFVHIVCWIGCLFIKLFMVFSHILCKYFLLGGLPFHCLNNYVFW